MDKKLDSQILWQFVGSASVLARLMIQSRLPKIMETFQLSEERFLVLYELHLRPNLSLKDLAYSQFVSAPSMSLMVNSMVEQGYIKRVQDLKDRRKVVLTLSGKGDTTITAIEAFMHEHLTSFLQSLPNSDAKELLIHAEAMNVITKRIAEEKEGGNL